MEAVLSWRFGFSRGKGGYVFVGFVGFRVQELGLRV